MSTDIAVTTMPLEPAAQEFADANADPPFLTELGPEKGREVLDQVQSGPGVARPDAEIEDFTIPGGPHGQVKIRLLKPPGVAEPLPVILYLHGEGYAHNLRAAGVDVESTRYGGVIHDFMSRPATRDTHGTRAALAQTVAFLERHLS
jgi:acetyl esterase/lipase